MRRVTWALVALLVAAGFGTGYLVRYQLAKPSTHRLEVEIEFGFSCDPQTDALDTFTLRRPGNGNDQGAVVAVAEKTTIAGCGLSVWFNVSPDLGFFMVTDENGDLGPWGPLDSHQLSARHWKLRFDR